LLVAGALAACSSTAGTASDAGGSPSEAGVPSGDSGGDAATDAGPSLTLLPNGQTHFGKTYPEWGSRWWQWLYELPQKQGDCKSPENDPSGELCTLGQSGEVYFLAGTRGGNATRTCTLPRGKALFFPIITYSGDNAGVPLDQQGTEDDFRNGINTAVNAMSELSLKLDGVAQDVSPLKVPSTQYTYTLPPEPNQYTCAGASGVVGLVSPAFHGGYYAMVAPPSPGQHTIEFGGRNAAFRLDVTYKLRIE
jgi:hypothetical protein